MTPVRAASEVFDAIQKVKAGATAYCTNFFPVQAKLQHWVDRGEMQAEAGDGAAYFFRRDRDFWHFYFCATDAGALRRSRSSASGLQTEKVVTDLVGNEATVGELIDALAASGFRRYSRLQRMARPGAQPPAPASTGVRQVTFAGPHDVPVMLKLLEAGFDRYADQLPLAYEIEAAIAAKQVLAVKVNAALAAALFFETQGLTSTVRYWVVGEPFRELRLGSILMRHYLAMHPAVRRFILWVVSDNRNAIEKYEHYGYAADGLIDHVLANNMIK